MITKHISKYFSINKYTYIVMFFSVIMGLFNVLLIISALLIMHELGHFITAKLFGIKVDKIYIYPFGGISKFHIPLNYSIIKEFLILINGPLLQEITKMLLISLFPRYNELIVTYHYSILIFNLLPIYPLDGGKIVNLLLSLINPYKKAIKVSVFISYITIIIILLLNINNIKINTLVMVLFLVYKVFMESKKIGTRYENFLLERYLKEYKFKKIKIIDNSNNFYKGKRHLIKINDEYLLEKDYLDRKYKKN